MDRTVKVTGFTFQNKIRSQLKDLFSRVSQVEHVYLDPDKNSAFVRLAWKSSLQFVTETRWEINSTQLFVRPALSQVTQLSSDQLLVRSAPDGPQRSGGCELDRHICAKMTYQTYQDGVSSFWKDVPHQNVIPVSKTKRKRRKWITEPLVSVPVTSCNKKKKRKPKTKRRKFRRQGFLVPAESFEFGLQKASERQTYSSENQLDHDRGMVSHCTFNSGSDVLHQHTKETRAAHCEEAVSQSQLVELHIKGDKTLLLQHLPVTASQVRQSIARRLNIPAELLHVTCEGHILNDDSVSRLQSGCTIHYTIKGNGGMEQPSGQKAQDLERDKRDAERFKEKGNAAIRSARYTDAVGYYTQSILLYPDATFFNNRAQSYLMLLNWDAAIADCNQVLRLEPENIKALFRRAKALKGKKEYTQALRDLSRMLVLCPSSQGAVELITEIQLERNTKEGVEDDKKPTVVESESISYQDNVGEQSSARATVQPPAGDNAPSVKKKKKKKKKGKLSTVSSIVANADVGEFTQSLSVHAHKDAVDVISADRRNIAKTADASDVKSWLCSVCGVDDTGLADFAGVDGDTLFAYSFATLHKFMKHYTNISIGMARKILFLRDNPDFKSEIMEWAVGRVLEFIEHEVPGNCDLNNFIRHHISGPAFLSYTDEELERELHVPGRFAFQIIVKRDKYLHNERSSPAGNKASVHLHQSSQIPSSGGDVLPAVPSEIPIPGHEDQSHLSEVINTQNLETEHLIAAAPSQTPRESTDHAHILLEDNIFSKYRMFVQDELQLFPVEAAVNQKLIKCELRVLYHKRKEMNRLEELFLFVVLCKAEFCKGKESKAAYTKVWELLMEKVPSQFFHTLPLNVQKLFEKDGQRIFFQNKPILFDRVSVKMCSIPEYDKTVRNLDQTHTKILLVDKQLLDTDSMGYSFELRSEKKSVLHSFCFDKDRQYWQFDSSDFTSFDFEMIPSANAGRLPAGRFWQKNEQKTSASNEKEAEVVTVETDVADLPSAQSCVVSQEKGAEDGFSNCSHLMNVEDEGESVSMNTECFDEDIPPEPVHKTISPRPFKKKNWKYEIGILRGVIETGDGMLTRAAEFKYQRGCAASEDKAKRSFLYKALEFVCGCLNARQNGTIYFGVAEGNVLNTQYTYGEIAGVEMDQKLTAEYYDLFRSHLDRCFPDNVSVAKVCTSGPYFVPVMNSDVERYVIEIDIDACAVMCKDIMFAFQPRIVFDSFGMPERKHVYLHNQKDWTGIFIRDGSETKYVSSKDKREFLQDTLPRLCQKREDEQKRQSQETSKLMASPDAEKLKLFLGEFEGMFPILILPKLSVSEKIRVVECFGFIRHVKWSVIIDFDNDSENDGVYCMSKGSVLPFDVHQAVISEFEDMSIDDRKDKLLFPKNVVWLFSNGKSTGCNHFDRLARKEWKNNYWTYMQNVVAFYKDNSVIPPTRRIVLILVSDELEDGILETCQDIKTAFGWRSVMFIFSSEWARDKFAQELSDDVFQHSVVMPWQHVYHVVIESLNVCGQYRDKYVCTSSGAHVPVPPSEWQSWVDLEVLSTKECLEEWAALSKEQRRHKANEEERKFYQGKPVSWWNFFLTQHGYEHVMKRSVMDKLLNHINNKIRSDESDMDRVPIVSVPHMPGAGGTTLGMNILWALKEKYKCAVIKKISTDTERQAFHYWETMEEGQDKRDLQPVILFADNLTNDASSVNEFELCRKLYRRQKELLLLKPLAILVFCQRQVRPEGEFQISQKLSDEEKSWLEIKHETLEQHRLKDEVATFIAFLAMRHEFDQGFLQNAMEKFVEPSSLDGNERVLVEYLSLITTYFPVSEGSPCLPVSACDELMRTIQHNFTRNQPWEKTLSKVARLLLVVELNVTDVPRNVVRISSQPCARVILHTLLQQNNETLGDAVIKCLKSSLVSSQSLSRKTVIQLLSKMLIERQVEEERAQMTHLSPLIMEIKGANFDKAAEVLVEGYNRLKNEVFYQQLARLFITVNNLEKAREFAQLAVELAPEKRDFKHTLGLVHLKRFSFAKDSVRSYDIDEEQLSQNMELLTIAFQALENFIQAQGKDDDDALSICYAYQQTVDTVNKILYFLHDVIPAESRHTVGRYLTEDDYDFPLFDDKKGPFRNTLKTLLEHGMRAMRFLFYLAHSHTFGKSGATYQIVRDARTMQHVTETSIKQFGLFSGVLKHLHKRRVHPSETKDDNGYRLENVKLKGCFFETIFYQFRYLRGRANKKNQAVATLQSIQHNLEMITDKTFLDMDNLMTVCLCLQLAGQSQAFSQNRSIYYKMCCDIIRSKDDINTACRARAHMYLVLLSWPEKNWEGFSEIDFRKSFQKKSSPLMNKKETLLPKVHFFVTRSSHLFYLCHWTDIFGDNENEQSQPLHEMSRLLKKFTGTYKVVKKSNGDQYSCIEMNWSCTAGELALKIWKIRGIKVFRDERVEFYLGFSINGPVAFIHRILDLEDYSTARSDSD